MFIDELKRMLKNYEIVRVEYKHFNDLYKLQLTYPEYFSTMQKHEVTLEECIEGTKVLPPKTKKNQKHYLGFYKDNKLHAISDIITITINIVRRLKRTIFSLVLFFFKIK